MLMCPFKYAKNDQKINFKLDLQIIKQVDLFNISIDNFLQDVYDDRSGKMVEVMDKCEKSIAEVLFTEKDASLP